MAPVRLGAPNNVSEKSEADDAETVVPAVEIVTETCCAPTGVSVPIVTINVVDVPPTSEQVAVMPLTAALHEAAVSCVVVMKLVPATVMVLPA